MIVSLYFFLADGPAMVHTLMRLTPLDSRYEQQLLDEFDRVSRAVVLGTLSAAVGQGVMAGIGFFFCGIPSVFLLSVLTMLFSMVPVVGGAVVWAGCIAWLYLGQDRLLAAVLLGVWGFIAASIADYGIKPYILHGQSNLHPLLALLSVLGGVETLGLIGIFVGPMVVAFLQALLNILRTELDAMEKRPLEPARSFSDPA
jgi:predicted PurR-regulated permease PerM